MVNCSLQEGLVPDGSLPVEDLKNYRPVSGLSFISKLVERVVAKQLVDHIHRHGLDNSYQSAYKSGHSTETALLSIKNDTHLSLSRGEATALVLLDLSAAFDTIDHSTLLSCLQDWFGVGGSALKWFSSYLMERFQSVKIGSTLSDLQKILFGVPQGSVLGPLLFSLYTSPLSTLIGKHKGVKFHFYADDSQLYFHLSHMNASAAFDKLNRCLQDVGLEWMSASKLKLNPDKTEFILFGSKKQRERLNVCFPIDILGNPLHPTKPVRNLGVWFDADFSFSKHVQNVCKSCLIQLRDFRNIRQFLTHDAAVSVANTFVSSRLDYCNSLFRSLSKNDTHLSLSRGEVTALVLLDLSAAFDTIDHSTLLSCLQDWFGVGGSALKWFSSYLMERSQSVKIGSTLSDLQKILFGVPQGSVLGPLLFSLYTSPLSTLIGKHKGVKFHFFADDSQLYFHLSHMNASAAFDKLNRCLQDVGLEWMSARKLKLNPDKTEFILFGSKKQRERLNVCFPIDILGNPLHPTKPVRNLGVWFDSDFSFSKHVQNVCKSCLIQLRDFRNIRQFLSHDAAVSVANTFVSSRLDYCNSLFRSLSKFNLHRLQSIQNSAARIVTNSSKYTRITPVLRKLHWLPVQFRSVQTSYPGVQLYSYWLPEIFCSISFHVPQYLQY